MINANKEKFHVLITIRNSQDNAYNTKVMLSFTENINYVKVKVRSFSMFVELLCSFDLHWFLGCWESVRQYGFWHWHYMWFQPFTLQANDKVCSLNNTKVECAVGYPFLKSNVEVRRFLQSHVSILVALDSLCTSCFILWWIGHWSVLLVLPPGGVWDPVWSQPCTRLERNSHQRNCNQVQ